jgi:hypothetical protein
LDIVHPVAKQRGTVAFDATEHRGMSGCGYDLCGSAGGFDQGSHELRAREHVVIRSGDGRPLQETANRIEVLVEIRVDLLPGARPRWWTRPSTSFHVRRLALGCRR